ncbi:MAG: hemin uptake protein HemP [Parvibaculum sp.]|nr:hemin uptake protein HemP [Parvibaculum sp.]
MTATATGNGASGGTAAGTTPALDSAELFRNGREVVIRHGEELYRLRLTSSNKLILIK